MKYVFLVILFNVINIIHIYCQDGDPLKPGVECPRGWYHDPLNAPQLVTTNECLPCARGKYGSTSGLTNPSCSGNCPRGRYGDKLAATSQDDCTYCPAGTFGASEGLVLKTCSGLCPTGKYSRTIGATSAASCLECPSSYKGNTACQNRNSILLDVA